jgi:hypothetical protein
VDPDAVHLSALALPTATTWGEAATSTLGPTPGHESDAAWADALALAADRGAGAVRIPLDWPRLQPRRGLPLDGGWIERTSAVIAEAHRLGLAAWATLHEAGVPRWFDDEGSFDDAEAAGRWWPRWVERAAETFGDVVDGWIPLVPTVANRRLVWRDTWGILRGGPPVTKVVTMPDDAELLHRDRELGDVVDCDRSGVVVRVPLVTGPDDHRRAGDQVGEWLRTVHDVGPDRPIVVAEVVTVANDPDDHLRGVEAAQAAIHDAVDDRVPIVLVFAADPLRSRSG